MFREIVDRSPDIVIRFDRELRHLFISRAVEEVTGLPPEHYLGHTDRELGMPDELCCHWERELGAVFEDGEPRKIQFQLDTLSGRRSFEAYLVPDVVSEGRVETILSFTRDRTELALAEERYADLVENASDAIITADLDGRLTSVNAAAERITGYRREQLLGLSLFDLIVPAGRDAARRLLLARIADGGDETVEIELVGSAGNQVFVEVKGHIVYDHGPPRLEAVARDTSQRHAADEELRRRALHDGLTGLPNRVLFDDRLRQALARARRERSNVAVLLLDLDDFKLVNDSLGHPAGDELLVGVARALTAVLRSDETVARMGGDEFALVAEGLHEGAGTQSIVARVQAVFATPFPVAGERRPVGASIGVALVDGDTLPEDALRDADVALYSAKQRGKGRYELFDRALREAVVRKVTLTSSLERALRAGELVVHYQPMVSLADGRILGVEALARWTDPALGPIAPDEFIPIAERGGLIGDLGHGILTAATRQLAAWRRSNRDVLPLGVSVNVSGYELRDPDFAVRVGEALEATGLRVGDLALELTERTFIDYDHDSVQANLTALMLAGVRLSLDDFGRDYAALSSLKQFRFDSLKIDRQFVSAITTASAAAPVTRAIVALGKALGSRVVAEGVETQIQVDYLRRLGCDAAQGIVFGPPAPPEAIASRFESESTTSNGHVDQPGPPGGIPAPIGPGEAERIAALRRYEILDTPPERAFDEIAHLAAATFDVPMAFVSLVDTDREFFKAAVGSDLRESPRDISFCGHAIHADGPFVVPDALDDERFMANPNVVGGPKIRFYAGAPLVTPDGQTIGELCVKDVRPRAPSAEQVDALTTLAHVVVAQLELERCRLLRGADRAPSASEPVPRPPVRAQYDVVFEGMADGAIGVGLDNRIVHANEAACRMLGYSEQELVGHDGHALLHHTSEDGTPCRAADCRIAAAARVGQPGWQGGEVFWRADGSYFPIEYCVVPVAKDDEHGGWLLLFHDVTERRALEEELEQSLERVRSGLAGSNVTLFAADLDGRYTWLENPTFEELGGPVAGLAPGRGSVEATSLRRIVELGEEIDDRFVVEVAGVEHHFHTTARPLRGPAGEIVGLAGRTTHLAELRDRA